MIIDGSKFYPGYSFIASVTQGQSTIVTFAAAHDFTNGEYISFRVSPPYGMIELNNKVARVISHDTLSVVVAIESINFTPFVLPGTTVAFPAMAVPAGSGIIPDSNPATINLEDAFDDKPIN